MRLVRYEDPHDGTVVELHPLLTVVSGVSPAVRTRLVDAISAIPRGEDPGATGSIEVYGVLLELSRETLDLLELHQDLDAVIRASDLPGATVEGPGTGLSAPGTTGADDPEVEVAGSDATVAGPVVEGVGTGADADDLRRAEAEADAVADAVRAAERAVEGIRDRLTELVSHRSALSEQIDAVRASLDPAAVADLEAAVAALDELERNRDEGVATQTSDARVAIENRLEELITRVDSLRREIKRLGAVDPHDVRDGLAELEDALDPAMIPSSEARDLADELVAIDDRLALLQSQAAGGRSQMLELTARRDAAYDALVAAEAALHSPDLDPAVVEELEAVHDEIFELDGRVAKLSSARLRRRMGELRDREDDLLGRLGFDSWASYVMGVSSADADTERSRRFEVAKATYEFAEDEVAKAAGSPVIESAELSDAEVRRRGLLDHAGRLLGGNVTNDSIDSVAESLRSLRVPATTSEPHDVAGRLLAALASAGAPLPTSGASSQPRETAAAASAWLAEISSVPARLQGLESERQRLELEITRQADALEALAEEEAALRRVALEGDGGLAAAREAVTDGRERSARHRQAADELERLTAEDGELAIEEEQLRSDLRRHDETLQRVGEAARVAGAQVAELRTRLESASAATAAAAAAAAGAGRPASIPAFERRSLVLDAVARASDIDGVEWYVLARLAQQRSVSFVGSVPVVFDDTFAEWSFPEISALYERLVRMSEVVQIIVVTDSVEVSGWARSLGRDRALALDLSPTSTPATF